MGSTDMIEILASLSSSAIGDSDYMGYFVNQRGNQLVFVQRPGEAQAMLLHSDLRWQPEQISPDAFRIGGRRRSGLVGVRAGADHRRRDLNQAEALWLAACFEASRWLRDG